MHTKLKKILSFALTLSLLFQQTGFVQAATVEMNLAAHIGRMMPNLASERFRPLHLRYLSYDNLSNNYKILLDKGDNKALIGASLEESVKPLMNFFLIGLALPNDTFWVNLRPDSPDQIIDDRLAQTDIGKIMLESDLLLKKDTAGMTSPATPEGKLYWDSLYKKAAELYGNEPANIPTLTRPWIVPAEVIIRESAERGLSPQGTVPESSSAYIYKATLKVMLEQDYLSSEGPVVRDQGLRAYEFKDERSKILNEYSSQLIRELIIPKLTKEVNSSKRYAPLRQVFYSLILSRWFKTRFSQSSEGSFTQRIDTQDLTNLTSKESWSKETFFKAYQDSFKQGEYKLQETVYTPTGQAIRSYFSGGIANLGASPLDGLTSVGSAIGDPYPALASKMDMASMEGSAGSPVSSAEKEVVRGAGSKVQGVNPPTADSQVKDEVKLPSLEEKAMEYARKTADNPSEQRNIATLASRFEPIISGYRKGAGQDPSLQEVTAIYVNKVLPLIYESDFIRRAIKIGEEAGRIAKGSAESPVIYTVGDIKEQDLIRLQDNSKTLALIHGGSDPLIKLFDPDNGGMLMVTLNVLVDRNELLFDYRKTDGFYAGRLTISAPNVAQTFTLRFDRAQKDIKLKVPPASISKIEEAGYPISGKFKNGYAWNLVTDITDPNMPSSIAAGSPVSSVKKDMVQGAGSMAQGLKPTSAESPEKSDGFAISTEGIKSLVSRVEARIAKHDPLFINESTATEFFTRYIEFMLLFESPFPLITGNPIQNQHHLQVTRDFLNSEIASWSAFREKKLAELITNQNDYYYADAEYSLIIDTLTNILNELEKVQEDRYSSAESPVPSEEKDMVQGAGSRVQGLESTTAESPVVIETLANLANRVIPARLAAGDSLFIGHDTPTKFAERLSEFLHFYTLPFPVNTDRSIQRAHHSKLTKDFLDGEIQAWSIFRQGRLKEFNTGSADYVRADETLSLIIETFTSMLGGLEVNRQASAESPVSSEEKDMVQGAGSEVQGLKSTSAESPIAKKELSEKAIRDLRDIIESGLLHQDGVKEQGVRQGILVTIDDYLLYVLRAQPLIAQANIAAEILNAAVAYLRADPKMNKLVIDYEITNRLNRAQIEPNDVRLILHNAGAINSSLEAKFTDSQGKVNYDALYAIARVLQVAAMKVTASAGSPTAQLTPQELAAMIREKLVPWQGVMDEEEIGQLLFPVQDRLRFADDALKQAYADIVRTSHTEDGRVALFINTSELDKLETGVSGSSVSAESYTAFVNNLANSPIGAQHVKLPQSAASAVSSAEPDSLQGNSPSTIHHAPGTFGGVDFGGKFQPMPFTIQPIGNFQGLSFELPKLSEQELASYDLDAEAQHIRSELDGGILPSADLVIRFMAASSALGKNSEWSEEIFLWLARMGMLQEDSCCESSVDYRQALMLVDSVGQG